jgi:antitoxin component HigA of HigAB toxin-antitoxin module
MILDTDYVELLVAHRPAKPRNREELAGMTSLLETLAANETAQTPAMERFIETLTPLVLQYEEEIQPRPPGSPAGVLKYVMEERGLRQVDLVPILGGKSYVSQIPLRTSADRQRRSGQARGVFPREPTQLSVNSLDRHWIRGPRRPEGRRQGRSPAPHFGL